MNQDQRVADRIRTTLEASLAPSHLEVIDESHKHAGHAHMMTERAGTAVSTGETHFRIKVVSPAFTGKSRLDRHRTINALLGSELGPGKVHALAIEARAPGE
jgi:BolA protein